MEQGTRRRERGGGEEGNGDEEVMRGYQSWPQGLPLTVLRLAGRLLFGCAHANLGCRVWLRGGSYWRTCMDCAQPVPSTLEEVAAIRPFVLTADVDREARARQVRVAYEEQSALRGVGAERRSGIARTLDGGDRAARDLERMVGYE